MKTWIFLLVASATWAVACHAADSQPNLLVILADDLGYADVGFNGGKTIATPNLDGLAASGVTLTDFRVCPMCSPTRAGLLTGRWPLRFGMMRAVIPPWSTYGLPSQENTLPEALASAGYLRRGIIGKWHLGHARQQYLPLANGFTRFVGCYNGAIDYFTHEREGECDWHHDDRTVREEGYSTDLIGAEAVRFIRESPRDEPWMLYIPFNAPHSPFQAKKSDLEKYPQFKLANRRAYAAMVDSMDQAIGRILAEVDAREETNNTLVLFCSDNGGVPKSGSSNAPFRGAKLTVYEGGTRVCAAIRWPAAGLSGGKRFAGRMGYIDVLPTLLAAADATAAEHVDGLNLLPALRGESSLPERPWFSYMHQDGDAHASVHLGHWKLVAHGNVFSDPAVDSVAPAPTLELYDLSTDIAETTDLAAQHPQIVNRLHALLQEFGSWQQAGVSAYQEGREGYQAPRDWVIQRP